MRTCILIITLWVVSISAVIAQIEQQAAKPDTAHIDEQLYNNGTHAPLYIINSRNKQFALDSTMRPKNIDPVWIESISILKSNQAIDIYGKKAQHGAVIITIKEEEFPQAFKALRKNMKRIKIKKNMGAFVDHATLNSDSGYKPSSLAISIIFSSTLFFPDRKM
jgi:hypothetical protein